MNSIHLIGRLTSDPETRFTRGGKQVTSLRLAVQRSRGAEDRGAVYVDVETWEGLAKVCADYLTQGRQVAVSGRLEHSEWTAEDGSRRQRHYVVAGEVEFLSGKPQSDEAAPDSPAEDDPPAEDPPAEEPKPKRRSTRRKADPAPDDAPAAA